jgi:hypothetical protein
MQRSGEGRVYLLDDVEEGGVGQVALGGTETAVLPGYQADDKGVEVGGMGHNTFLTNVV